MKAQPSGKRMLYYIQTDAEHNRVSVIGTKMLSIEILMTASRTRQMLSSSCFLGTIISLVVLIVNSVIEYSIIGTKTIFLTDYAPDSS